MGYLYGQITAAGSRLFSFAAALTVALGLVAFGIMPADNSPGGRPIEQTGGLRSNHPG